MTFISSDETCTQIHSGMTSSTIYKWTFFSLMTDVILLTSLNHIKFKHIKNCLKFPTRKTLVLLLRYSCYRNKNRACTSFSCNDKNSRLDFKGWKCNKRTRKDANSNSLRSLSAKITIVEPKTYSGFENSILITIFYYIYNALFHACCWMSMPCAVLVMRFESFQFLSAGTHFWEYLLYPSEILVNDKIKVNIYEKLWCRA